MVNHAIKQRNSSFELVKIIAIVCIVFCHSIPAERIEYHYATSDPWLFGIILFRQLGSVGNAIFMVASTWFLVDDNRTNLRKVKSIIADNQVISVIILIVMACVGYRFTINTIVKQIFPFLFSTLWYITCYLMYYCLHGFINKALISSGNIKAKVALIVLFSFNSIVFIFGGLYFTLLVGFIIIHIFTWYLKKMISQWSTITLHKLGLQLLLFGLLGWLLGAIIINIIGIRISVIGAHLKDWNAFYNPFILSIAYGCIILASCNTYHSSQINKISGLSLYIYMITGNQLLRIYPDNELYDICKINFGTEMIVCFLYIIVCVIVKLIIGYIMAYLYDKTIAKFIRQITNKECNFVDRKIKKILM